MWSNPMEMEIDESDVDDPTQDDDVDDDDVDDDDVDCYSYLCDCCDWICIVGEMDDGRRLC